MKSEYVICTCGWVTRLLSLPGSNLLGVFWGSQAASLPHKTNKNEIRMEYCLSNQRIFAIRGGKYLKKSPSPTFRQIIYYFFSF